MTHRAGESKPASLRVNFDRRLKLEFNGSKITSDVGFLAYRALGDAFGLSEAAVIFFKTTVRARTDGTT